ncbi:MAG: serine hydrolase, partial [Proteobacteria bacterium]|nr:serine hydrolase [Pseudomonadota bacterium]
MMKIVQVILIACILLCLNVAVAQDSVKDNILSHIQPSHHHRYICPDDHENWFNRLFSQADRTSLNTLFEKQNYTPPQNSYALIAPIRVQNGIPCLEYYSYRDTAFVFSMKMDGEENFWPASTVKLMAAVLALVKLREYNLSSQARLQFNDIEGHFEGTVQMLCREAIIPSNNTAYNRLMEIAGFDQTNDDYLLVWFHFPTMTLQRRYARHHPDDNIRQSPAMLYRENEREGLIPLRTSAGRKRHFCPREGNCMTLAELAEVMMRVVLHRELPDSYRFPILATDAD